MVSGIPARILENIDYAVEKGQLDVADLKLIIDGIDNMIDYLENPEDDE
jgi:hypothetical protein